MQVNKCIYNLTSEYLVLIVGSDLSDVVFTLVVYNILLNNMDNQDLPGIYAHALRLVHISGKSLLPML